MSGKLLRYHNGPLLWSAKGQTSQAMSSTGAESNSLITGCVDAFHVRDLAYEFNIEQREPMKVYTDNKGAVFIAEDAEAVKRSRTDARGAIVLQDAVEEGIIQMKHWPGNDNVADIFTKWLPHNTFEKYRSVLLNLRAQCLLGIPVDSA